MKYEGIDIENDIKFSDFLNDCAKQKEKKTYWYAKDENTISHICKILDAIGVEIVDSVPDAIQIDPNDLCDKVKVIFGV